jgi:hypothetical protein
MLSDCPLDIAQQKIYRYADPVFVASESIQRYVEEGRLSTRAVERLKTMLWWNLLLTTKILLAHTGLQDIGELLLTTVICNVRGTLFLVGVDISTKSAYSGYAENDVVWIRIAFGGDRRLSMRGSSDSDIIVSLSSVSLTEVKEDFEMTLRDDELGVLGKMLGCAVYRLVATRDSGWKSSARRFEHVHQFDKKTEDNRSRYYLHAFLLHVRVTREGVDEAKCETPLDRSLCTNDLA